MASQIFQELLSKVPPETTQKVKTYMDRLENSKVFSEIEIGQQFSPIYKSDAELFFEKIDHNHARVTGYKNAENFKVSIYFHVGDIIFFDVDSDNRFEVK